MRNYSVLLFTSSALLAYFDSVLAASGSNLRTVDHTSENGFAIKRLLRLHETMGEKEEERVSFSPGELTGMSKVADDKLTQITSALMKNIKLWSWRAMQKDENVVFNHIFRVDETNPERNFDFIEQGLNHPELGVLMKFYSSEQKLVDDLIQLYKNHEDLALALYKVKASKQSTENPATELYNTYFERLIADKKTPLSMFGLWNNGKPLHEIFFRTSMIKVLGEFVEYYNKNSQTQTTLLQTLREGFTHDYELAPVLALAKKRGDKTAENLQAQLVQDYINKGWTLKKVLTTLRLTETDYTFYWNFDTLNEFAKLSKTEENLLQTLSTGFGGVDKLAPALAEASKWDVTAKNLRIKLLRTYEEITFGDFFGILNLKEDKLTTNDLNTLELFVEYSKATPQVKEKWSEELARLSTVVEKRNNARPTIETADEIRRVMTSYKKKPRTPPVIKTNQGIP